MTESLPDIEALGPEDLKRLVLQLLEEVAALRAENAALRAEIARLKGLKGLPKIKPSGMDRATDPKPAGRKRKRRGRGSKLSRSTIDEECIVKADVPDGSRFKGYEDYVVQDLILRPHVVRYRRQRWLTPDGRIVVAPLPAGIAGHFGPELRRFVLAQYHRGQVTVPRLVGLLRDIGVDISERQVVRLLNGRQEGFMAEAREVLRAGLETARWITVDDTGARHKAANGVCTQVGDHRFAWFGTTFSKSRLNFLSLLRAGHGDYVVNAAALDYMRKRSLSGAVIALLAEHESERFADEDAWMAHLERLGIAALKVHPDPVRIATEGALWGSVVEHGFLREAVIVSDDAGQFNVGRHALCWVHAERLIHQLVGFNERQRQAIERIRARVWRFYKALKAYCRDPTARAKAALDKRFERLFSTRTGFATLDRLLMRLRANKDELLLALERPDIPLHTNGSENDIRCQVTKRKVSGGTRSDAGRDARDAFLGLMKTCDKLGVSFWDYLGSRLMVESAPVIAPLPNIVRQRASQA
ncbi:MAG: transposase [Pseudomonadota bacterium]|nr:transposase [Pseudomonadota bacterium]